MDDRIERLEQFAGETRDRLARVETKLDHIDREVSQFKWWVAGSVVALAVTMFATVWGMGVAIQQMTVSTFQAAAQAAHPPASAPR